MSISQVSSGGVSQLCQSVKSSAPSKEADIITLTYQEIMTNLIGDKFFKEEDSLDYGCFDRGEQGRDVRGRNKSALVRTQDHADEPAESKVICPSILCGGNCFPLSQRCAEDGLHSEEQ